MSEMLKVMLLIAGVLHFSLLLAGLSIPRVLRWKDDLAGVDPFSRQIIWVHGAFVVMTIIAFGAITIVAAEDLAQGGLLPAAVTTFIGMFWLIRLAVQFFYFDARRWLTTRFRRVGYRSLTAVFAYLSLVYLTTACVGWSRVWAF